MCPDLSEQEKRDIKAEVYRKLEEQLREQEFCKKMDNQYYKMEKSLMFRRLQQEKEERMLQDCLCKVQKICSLRAAQAVAYSSTAISII